MANNIRKYMYVRCPFDREHPRIPRDFIMGQVVDIDSIADMALVKFRDPFNFRRYYENIPDEPIRCPMQLLTHVSAYKNSTIAVSYTHLRGRRCVYEIRRLWDIANYFAAAWRRAGVRDTRRYVGCP